MRVQRHADRSVYEHNGVDFDNMRVSLCHDYVFSSKK